MLNYKRIEITKEKQEADIQCPFIKFKMILEIIEGLENG